MFKKFCAGLLAVVVVAGICGSAPVYAQAPQKAAPKDYMPLKVGSQWDYRAESDGEASKFSMRAAKIERIEGLDLTLMEVILDGNIVSSEHMLSNQKGIFRHGLNGQPLPQPICVLKGGAKVGDTWKSIDTEDGVEVVITAKVTALEEVTVPAGKFQALRVEYDITVDGESAVTMTQWFVANVGPVKQAIEVGDGLLVIELERYQPAR